MRIPMRRALFLGFPEASKQKARDLATPKCQAFCQMGAPTKQLTPMFIASHAMCVQGDLIGGRTGNGEKLRSSQAELGQAIKSAVA